MVSAIAPHLTNNFFIADRISSACDPELVNVVDSDSPYVDPFYGNNWSWTPAPGAALYGRTESLPNMSVDDLEHDGFLRVPFRRVPLLIMNSYDELKLFVERVKPTNLDQTAMWRGQNSLYTLSRQEIDRLRLFGDPGVIEPSLVPSSVRKGTTFEQVFEIWSSVMELYLVHYKANQDITTDEESAEIHNFINSLNFKIWSMATAQHYGLPSSGLDLTDNIDVAIFFALNRFSPPKSGNGGMAIERLSNDVEPVVFGLSVFDNDLFRDIDLAPNFLQCERPKAQSAHYFGTSWGNASNKAADRMWVALKLRDHESWNLSVTKEDLFPDVSRDPIVEFLLNQLPKFQDARFEEIIKQVYFID